MKKLSFLVALVAILGLIAFGSRASADIIDVNFELLDCGTDVTGPDKVATGLDIQSLGNAVVVCENDPDTMIYRAPSELALTIHNGCLGNPGGYATGGSQYGQGFSDLITGNAHLPHNYVFTFSEGTTVTQFSITMLDYGDFNPSLSTYHEVRLTAYDELNQVVGEKVLSYNTDPVKNPRSSFGPDFGDLWFTGDACTAQLGEPGNYLLHVEGEDIVRVELEFPVGADPRIAFDEIHAFTTIIESSCGDGILDEGAGEECDDGNLINGDGCNANCTTEFCGDGVVNNNTEQCDDGNTDNEDACRNDCTLPTCGDGIVDQDQGEQCDDGNDNNNDGCRNDCTLPFCGDGIKDPNEQCDDGNDNNEDCCRNDCTEPRCGDGIPDTGEECDDGNDIDNDKCRNDCKLPSCGDGFLDPGEQCDDGNDIDDDECRNDCKLPELCGECDGKVTVLTLQYTGASSALIRVEQSKCKDSGNIIFQDSVQSNETFTFSGEDKKGTLGTDICIYTDGVQNTQIHTSCSEDIYPGLVSGAFVVVKGYSRNGGLLCPLESK